MHAKIPPIFVSHGIPDLALDEVHGGELAQWAKSLPRPRGILVVCAFWRGATPTRGVTRGGILGETVVNGAADVRYEAPAASELAYDLATVLPVEREERGWDHGVWSPVRFMYPEANIPVLQLSLVQGASPRRLFGIGRRLGTLAERGHLVVGSGAITYNTGDLAPDRNAPPREYARAFDAWVTNLLADAAIDELLGWRTNAPDPRLAHPEPGHLDPLFVVAGAASLYEHAVGFPIRGFDHGTVSRRCVQLGRPPT